MRKVYNFYAGPAVLPREALERAQAELLDFADTGMSVLEISHRSKEYEQVNAEAMDRIRGLLGLGSDYHVLFLQGGASTQFAMLPMNFLPGGRTADYVLTGSWSEKALAEARGIGRTHVAASTRDGGYRRVPGPDEVRLSDSPAYVHITSNNTIYGTQWHRWPEVGSAPLVADMSSDIMSRPIDAARFALIYAGAQKNLGPAGLTVVIVRDDFLRQAREGVPTMLSYRTHAESLSLYNTPPVFAVYLTNLVLEWIEGQGGLRAMEERNRAKAKVVYDALDASDGYYRGHAEPDSRSIMNVTFRLPDEAQEREFVSRAGEEGFVGLKGHRSVGGIRVSLYNAMTLEGASALAEFMGEFARAHG